MGDIHVYYIRDFQRRPVVTVALCDHDGNGTVCRGVSLCSELDAPVKTRGRHIAMGRMWKAYFHQEDSEPIRNMRRVPDVDGLFEIDEDGDERLVFEFKSGYDVEMTEYELNLMDDDFRREGLYYDEFDDEVDNREGSYFDVIDGCYKNL